MNSDTRSRLAIGSELDENYIVVEYLNDYDTDTALVYKVRDQGGELDNNFLGNAFAGMDESEDEAADPNYNYFIIQEYYPIIGCLRNADGSLSIDEKLIDKQQFDKGRSHFFKAYLEMSKPSGNQRFGLPIDYQMFNETAYYIFDYNAYDFQKKIQSLPGYEKLPPEYLPSYQGEAELAYEVSDDALTIKGIDFNDDVYSYLLQGGVAALVDYIREGVSSDREALYDMLLQLEEFEAGGEGTFEGEKGAQLTFEAMDKELGLDDHEWRLLRHLIKPNDEFFSWVLPGNCSGVAMSRDGRVFKNWVRTIS